MNCNTGITYQWPRDSRFMVRAMVHVEARQATFVLEPSFSSDASTLQETVEQMIASWTSLDQGAFFSIVIYEDNWDARKALEIVRTTPDLALRLLQAYVLREQPPTHANAASTFSSPQQHPTYRSLDPRSC